jgi:PII interaction protein X
MGTENYLSHPNLGLLFRVCLLDEHRELFATLYAQRLFFLVSSEASGFRFEPIGRLDSRLLVEGRLRELRRAGQAQEYSQLQAIHKQTFQ